MATRDIILGVDFGSSHAYAGVYTSSFQLLGSSSSHLDQRNYNGDINELDPEAAWLTLCKVMRDALASAQVVPEDLKCVGLSVQRNTLLLWDKRSSRPLTPAISWQDLRASDLTDKLNRGRIFRSLKTSGRLLYQLFRVPRLKALSCYNFKTTLACVRLKYLLNSRPDLRSECKYGTVCYGGLETWFLWRLTAGESFFTDFSCASVSGMYDPFKCNWSGLIISNLGIPTDLLPDVRPTSCFYGYIRDGPLRSVDSSFAVPVTALIGDAQAATLAEGCLQPGQAKLTLGTGSFLNINTGNQLHVLMDGFYPVIGWSFPGFNNKCTRQIPNSSSSTPSTKNVTFLLEGNQMHTGTKIEWLKTSGYFNQYTELEEMLNLGDKLGLDELAVSRSAFYLTLSPSTLVSDDQLVCVGPDGIYIGLQQPVTEVERLLIVRVVMESIALGVRQLLDRCRKEASLSLVKLRANGNAAQSNWLMQRVADLTGIPVERSSFKEPSCLGAAIAAGVGAEIWPNYNVPIALLHSTPVDDPSHHSEWFRLFRPNPIMEVPMQTRYQAWRRACVEFTGQLRCHSTTINGQLHH